MRAPIESKDRSLALVFGEMRDGQVLAALYLPTGEIREQTLDADRVSRVRASTVQNRMERYAADDLTPHVLVQR